MKSAGRASYTAGFKHRRTTDVIPFGAPTSNDSELTDSQIKITDVTKALMTAERLKKILGTTYGGTSQEINASKDMFGFSNGGTIKNCLSGQYQRDFNVDRQ
jgi:hypothetical protein